MAAAFVTESFFLPQHDYLGLKASNALSGAFAPYYGPSGLVQYQIFTPDPAAVAAYGLTGARLPALVQMHAQGGAEWTGTLAAPTGNSGQQTRGEPGQPGDKLGANGTPDVNWPTYVIFPQFTTDWDGIGDNAGADGVGTVTSTAGATSFSQTQGGVVNGNQIVVAGVPYVVTAFNGTNACTLLGSPTFGPSAFFVYNSSAGAHKHRAGFAITEYCMRDAMSKYPIDRNRLILTGVSSGGSEGLGYLYARARYPHIFTIDFGAFIGISTWIGITARGDFIDSPGATEDYTLVTTSRVARAITRLGVSMYFVNSVNDGTINPGDLVSQSGYLSTQAAFMRYYKPQAPTVALTGPARDYIDCGEKLQIINYTTGSPTHNNVWPQAYSNNVPGGPMNINDPMWAWAMRQRRGRFRDKRARRAA